MHPSSVSTDWPGAKIDGRTPSSPRKGPNFEPSVAFQAEARSIGAW